MKLRMIVAALAMCGSLTACNWEIGAKRTDGPLGETTEIYGKLSGTIGRSGNRFLRYNSAGLDVSNIAIDITGHRTAVLDGFGTGTLLVKQDDTVIGSTAFVYAVADSMAVIADPSAINAWLTQFPSADSYDVKLHDVPTVDTEEGIASLTVDTLYGTTVVSTGSTSWTSSAGSGCIPGGNHGNPGGVQPIELPGDGGGVCP